MDGGLLADRLDSRRKAFKKGVDPEDQRRRREDEALSLRKAKKEGLMAKRRQLVDLPYADAENAPVNAAAAKPRSMQAMASRLLVPIPAEERLMLTIEIRKQLSVPKAPPTQQALDAGLLPVMLAFMAQAEDTPLQFEALWVLTNIASDESHMTEAVARGGAVPMLVELLAAPRVETADQACWCLANIAGDSHQLRDFVLQLGALPAVLQLLVRCEQQGNGSGLRNAVWAVGNLCRGRPAPPLESLAVVLPYLTLLLNHPELDVQADALWVLSYLSDGESARIEAVLGSGALPQVVRMLGNDDERVAQPALRVCGNIAAGSAAQTQRLLESGCLQALPSLLRHRKKAIRKEALWALSNVTAGTEAQIQQVLDCGVLPDCIELARTGDWGLRKEALWCVSNVMLGGGMGQVEFLFQLGAARLLVEALDQNSDAATTVCVLEGLGKLLEHGAAHGDANVYADAVEEADGLSKLEQLQEDANEAVYEKALSILTTYFSFDEGDENAEPAGPSLVTSGFSFA